MKKYIFLVITLLFSALCLNVFGQTKSYPFEVAKTGKGKQTIIFLPGFASSGDVWNETKSNFEKEFTCYTFTMAGFAGVKPQLNASFKNWETEIVNYIKANKIENLQSALLALNLKGGYLGAKTQSDQFQQAMATLYQEIAINAYPQFPSLVTECEALVRRTGKKPDIPVLGGAIIEATKRLLGWKSAKQLRKRIHSLRK